MKISDIVYAKTGVTINWSNLSNDVETQALLATLIAIVANCDGDITRDENTRMMELLQSRYGIAAEDSTTLINRAVSDLKKKSDVSELIARINDELTLQNKEELMSMVLHIIATDDKKDAREMELLGVLIDGLKIPDNIMENAYDRYFRDSKVRG